MATKQNIASSGIVSDLQSAEKRVCVCVCVRVRVHSLKIV